MFQKTAASLALVTLLLCGCAGTTRLASQPCLGTVQVDGLATEWAGKIQSVEDQPLSLGVQDDGENLYLVLATASTQIQERIMRQGLVLWLDAEGGKLKNSGIRYPIGMMESGGGMRRGEAPGEVPDAEERAARLVEGLESQVGHLRFLTNAEDDGWTLEHSELNGLELAYRLEAGRLILEAKIPLFAGPERSLSIGLEDSAEIGLGVEIPAPERPQARGGAGGGMGGQPGGMGGGGGRGGGMGGGGRGGGMGGPPQGMEAPEAVEFWTKIELSV